MPDPSNYDNEDDWLSACIPAVMDEGKPNDQAVAQCMQMWRDRDKALPLAGRAYSILTVKSVQEDQRIIRGTATTPETDRIGDIVESKGILFKNPMPLLLHHRHDQPVGKATFDKPSDKGITFEAKIAKIAEPGVLKDRLDEAWQSIKAGLIAGVSIGFKPRDWELLDDGGIRFVKSEVYELSLVTIPANASATISVIKSLDTESLAASGKQETPPTRPGVAGKKSGVSLKRRSTTMTITEQIATYESSRAAKSARLDTLMEEAGKAGETLDAEQSEEYEDLDREVKAIDVHLKRLRDREKANIEAAKPVNQVKTVEDGAEARGGGYVRVRAPQLPPGIRFARVAKCKALARLDGQDVVRVAERLYGDDQPIINICKAAVGAGTTLTPAWAGNLVSDEGAVFADFLEYLRPMTILGKFGTDNVPALRQIPFRVPVGSQTSGGAAYWTGEGLAKGLTRFDFGKTSLEPLKVASIVVVTEELLRYASIPAEALLRDQLAAAVTAKIDTDFIDPGKTSVTNISPASITNGVTPVASSGVTADHVRADVAALLDNFIAVDNPASSATWIMSASTALRLSMMYNTLGTQEFNSITVAGGTFAGFPVIVSEYVGTSGGSPNTRYVWLVNARDLFFADEGQVNVDMSREASLVMDTAPTMASAEMGSPQTPITGNMVSMFQTNSVAFRAERVLNWARARTEAVQGLSGVAWGT